MDIFFQDPSEIPLPPEEVRIREVHVQPSTGDRRVRIYLEVDPFQKRPNLDLFILDESGRVVSSAFIIESMTRKMELTMHIREEITRGDYELKATMYYLSKDEGDPESEPDFDDPMIVHEVKENFRIGE